MIFNTSYSETVNNTITSIIHLEMNKSYDMLEMAYRITATSESNDTRIYDSNNSSYLSSYHLINLKCFTSYMIHAYSMMDFVSEPSLQYVHLTEICGKCQYLSYKGYKMK